MSTPASNPGDAITAALLQITQQAERLAVLDEREAAHCREIAARLAGLAGHVTATGKRVDDIRVTAERPSSAHSTGSTRKSAALATRITGIADTLTSEEDGNLTLAPTGPPRAALVETARTGAGRSARTAARLVEQIAEQMYLETTRCRHASSARDRGNQSVYPPGAGAGNVLA